MEGLAFDLPVGPGAAGEGIHVHGAADLGHVAIFILDALIAADDIGALEADLVAGEHPLILLRRNLHEVVLLDIQLAAEGNLTGAELRMIRMVFQGNSLRLALGPVGQDDLQGPKDGHGTEGGITQDIADAVLKDGVIHGGIRLAHADGIDKVPDGHRGIAAAAHGRESGHARIRLPPAGGDSAST